MVGGWSKVISKCHLSSLLISHAIPSSGLDLESPLRAGLLVNVLLIQVCY